VLKQIEAYWGIVTRTNLTFEVNHNHTIFFICDWPVTSLGRKQYNFCF